VTTSVPRIEQEKTMTDRTLQLNLAQAAQDLADYLKANELTAENYQSVRTLFHSVTWIGEVALKISNDRSTTAFRFQDGRTESVDVSNAGHVLELGGFVPKV
jgi:hypothetical protein